MSHFREFGDFSNQEMKRLKLHTSWGSHNLPCRGETSAANPKCRQGKPFRHTSPHAPWGPQVWLKVNLVAASRSWRATSQLTSYASSRTCRHLQFCQNGIIPSFGSHQGKETVTKEGRSSPLFFVAICSKILFIWLFWQGPRWGMSCWKKQRQNAHCFGERCLSFQEPSLVLVDFPATKAKLKLAEVGKAFKGVTGERVGKCFNWLLKLPVNCHRAIFSKASLPLAKFIRKLTSAPPLAACPCPFPPLPCSVPVKIRKEKCGRQEWRKEKEQGWIEFSKKKRVT